MYVLEHAILNLIKNKERNILLGIIMFAVITAAVIALSIFNGTDSIIANARVEFNSMVQIRPQGRQMNAGAAGSETTVTREDLYYFAESAHLSGVEFGPGTGFARGNETIFYLRSADLFEAFEEELRAKGLPEDWTVFRDEASFHRMIAPIENLKEVSFTFLLVVLGFGAAIMTLLTAISIRERKYEIGVLRAMGMKKNKVSVGLLTELFVITSICFVGGLLLGTLLTTPIANLLSTGENTIYLTLEPITAIQILGVSMLLALIAGVVSISRITKYEPIKILMNRN